MIHIAEEMKQPERNIPIVMYVSHLLELQETRLIFPRILTLTIGFFTAFPLLLAMMLGMTDIDAVIDSPFPYAELLYQITGSKLVTTAIMCWVSMVLYCRSKSQGFKDSQVANSIYSGLDWAMDHLRTISVGICTRRKHFR